jgi:hypothetical protein
VTAFEAVSANDLPHNSFGVFFAGQKLFGGTHWQSLDWRN